VVTELYNSSGDCISLHLKHLPPVLRISLETLLSAFIVVTTVLADSNDLRHVPQWLVCQNRQMCLQPQQLRCMKNN